MNAMFELGFLVVSIIIIANLLKKKQPKVFVLWFAEQKTNFLF